MPVQKTKGAKPVLERLYGLIDSIADEARQGQKHAIYNPPFAQKRLGEILDIVTDLRELVREQVEPFMERQAPQYDKRLSDLEERLARLEQSNVTPFRKAQ